MSLVIIEYNPIYHKMSNEKSQVPNNKQIIIFKFLNPKILFVLKLIFEIYLGFGLCQLKFNPHALKLSYTFKGLLFTNELTKSPHVRLLIPGL